MKKFKILIVPVLLILLLLAALFFFSSQNGEQSGQLSKSLTKRILELFIREPTSQTIFLFDRFLRKLAHFFLYTVLGAALTAAADLFFPQKKSSFFLVLLIGVMIAAADETHQLWSAGRAGRLSDVILDTGGVIFGFGLKKAAESIWKKKIKSKLDRDHKTKS